MGSLFSRKKEEKLGSLWRSTRASNLCLPGRDELSWICSREPSRRREDTDAVGTRQRCPRKADGRDQAHDELPWKQEIMDRRRGPGPVLVGGRFLIRLFSGICCLGGVRRGLLTRNLPLLPVLGPPVGSAGTDPGKRLLPASTPTVSILHLLFQVFPSYSLASPKSTTPTSVPAQLADHEGGPPTWNPHLGRHWLESSGILGIPGHWPLLRVMVTQGQSLRAVPRRMVGPAGRRTG